MFKFFGPKDQKIFHNYSCKYNLNLVKNKKLLSLTYINIINNYE